MKKTKKEEIPLLSPIEAYNRVVEDCLKSAYVRCVGDPRTMSCNNCSPRDISFFGIDPETILQNKFLLNNKNPS